MKLLKGISKIAGLFFVCLCLLPPPCLASEARSLKIISLKPNITDIVYALGLGDSVVGVTKYCDVPDGRIRPPVVGDYTQPYTERIIALSPDIVLGSKENSSRKSIETLEKIEVRVELFSFATIDEILESIRKIGDILGASKGGGELADKIGSQFSAMKKTWSGKNPKRALVVWGIRPLIVAGPGSYMDELLAAVGAINVVSGTMIKYPRIGIEELIALNPDVIIDLSMEGETYIGDSPHAGTIPYSRPWDGIDEVRAVKDKAVVRLDASAFRAGPNLPEALELLARRMHN